MSNSAYEESLAKWQAKVDKLQAKHPERKEQFTTLSGLPVERLYLPPQPDDGYTSKLGFPGDYPYTRGVQPTMYRGRFWTMRQYAGFATAQESNRRYRYLLDQGQTGLSVAFDLPTQIGYDSDHELSRGEVGKVGVSISSLADMELLLDQIPLDKVSTSMTINAPAGILLAMYIAVAEKQGVSADKLRGTIQNDILKEYSSRGTYIYPPKPSMRIITDIFAWCREHAPRWNTISISGYHIREAGSTAVQEVAFTLADAVEYVGAAVKAGLAVDEFAPRLSFFFCVHNNVLEEVAKFRAARRIWARIMRERFGAKEDKSCLLRFHTQTAGCSLTAQQIENNVVRVTLQALAAVLGGTQSLHTNSKDEALSLPSTEAALTALRTQQIVAEESGVCDTIDPLGGSWFVERMTDDLEERITTLMGRIGELGGMTKAIERQFPQREIERSAYEYQRGVESGDIPVVGVNVYTGGDYTVGKQFRVNPEIEHRYADRLAAHRASRDAVEAARLLDDLEKTARGDGNLMPPIIEAVKGGCTLGEISATMEKVFGRYAPVSS
jgi:methylmalonyl-CoA mutase, N-terminal domain